MRPISHTCLSPSPLQFDMLSMYEHCMLGYVDMLGICMNSGHRGICCTDLSLPVWHLVNLMIKSMKSQCNLIPRQDVPNSK